MKKITKAYAKKEAKEPKLSMMNAKQKAHEKKETKTKEKAEHAKFVASRTAKPKKK